MTASIQNQNLIRTSNPTCHGTGHIIDSGLGQICSFEEIPDPDSQYRQPVLTISDASVADADKQLILLVAGEHSRELITSEIVFWLVSLFLDEVSWESAKSWSQTKEVEQHAVGKGWADTDLRTWARVLLHRVVFKVLLQNLTITS